MTLPLKYKLLHGDNPETLSDEVTAHLEQGWELCCNPFASSMKGSYGIVPETVFCQAVWRYGQSVPPIREEKDELAEPSQSRRMAAALEMVGAQAYALSADHIVESAKLLFAGILCSCFERPGDNPDCPVHKTGVVSHARPS